VNPRLAGGMGRLGRREVVDVAERRAPDRRLDGLLHVRKQRLSRFERERNEARQAWRAARRELAALKLRWRRTRDQAQQGWQAARAAFSEMTITSGEFKKARAIYERTKKEASGLRVEWNQSRQVCRGAGAAFFASRLVVLQAHMQQEKLSILRDEVRAREAALNAEA